MYLHGHTCIFQTAKQLHQVVHTHVLANRESQSLYSLKAFLHTVRAYMKATRYLDQLPGHALRPAAK